MMHKQEFLEALRNGLSGLPREDVEERLTFYGEMIDDRMEEGCPEEAAVSAVGDPSEIAAQIIEEIPLTKLARTRWEKQRRMGAWQIVLLALGSPIWLSLGLSVGAVVISVYVSLWAGILSLWAGFAALAGCAVGGAAGGILLACTGRLASGLATLAAGFVCAGLSILMYFGCRAVTKGMLQLTKRLVLWIKHWLIKKEDV